MKWSLWLPTRGNVLFTLLIALALISTQTVWAKNLNTSAASIGANATTVNYQGRLADTTGSPLNGNYNITFTIFNALEGGDALWSESHTNVQVSNGLFSLGLGSLTPGGVPLILWGEDRYLEIAVNGEALSPRETIRSVPLAGMALTVPPGAITADHISDGAITQSKLSPDINFVPDGSITAEKLANGAVASQGMVLNYFSNVLSGAEVAINTTAKTVLTLDFSVPYSANCLVMVNVTPALDQSGRAVVWIKDENNTGLQVLHIANSIAGNNGTQTESLVKIFPFPAGQHTLKLDVSTSSGTGRVRGAEIVVIPFASPNP